MNLHISSNTLFRLSRTDRLRVKTRKINNAKLNENIKDELTKQIDFLQKGILSIAEQKSKREANQNSEIYKKTKENAELIKHLNIKKKAYTILEKDFFITKSDLSAKIKKYEQLEREKVIQIILY